MKNVGINNTIQKKYNWNLIWLILLSSISFGNYFFDNDFLALLMTILLCLYIFICDKKCLIPSMVFINSFAYLFRFNEFNLYSLICLIFIVKVGLKEKRRIINTIIIGIPYLLLHLFSTYIFDLSFADIVPFILIFTLYFAACEYTSEAKIDILLYFVIGHVISTIFGLLKPFTRLDSILGQDYISVVSWADTTRFSGISFDPNFYTLMAIVVLCTLAFFLLGKISSVVWFLLSVITLAGGALTFSKSFYLCVIVLLVYFMLINIKQVGFREIRLFIVVTFLCCIFRDNITNIIDAFLTRFDVNDSIDGLTTGRWSIWGKYIEQIMYSFDTILVGHGLISGGMKAAHNLFLEMIYKFGLLGTMFDVVLFALCKKEMKITLKSGIMPLIVIVLFISLLFNLSVYSFAGFWATVLVILLIISDDVNKQYLTHKAGCKLKKQ